VDPSGATAPQLIHHSAGWQLLPGVTTATSDCSCRRVPRSGPNRCGKPQGPRLLPDWPSSPYRPN